MSRLSEGDAFGKRMKEYEYVETSRKLNPHLPIYARIDGRSFHSFTRGMVRPFDQTIGFLMSNATVYLVKETNACIGYTQSDEISLVWLIENDYSDIFFSGKTQKLCSILASMTTAKFMLDISEFHPDSQKLMKKLPNFDCRVLQLPSKMEAANMFLWRAMDARKNSISMVAQAFFSPNQLHGKDQKDMLSMLANMGIDFETKYHDMYKHGSFFRSKPIMKDLTNEELERIPLAVRPTGPVQRTVVERIDMPPFNKVVNRIGVIFNGEEPQIKETQESDHVS